MNIKRVLKWVASYSIIILIMAVYLLPFAAGFLLPYGQKCRELGGKLDIDWQCYKVTVKILQVGQ